MLWTGWGDGYWNMAVDEWLLSTAHQRPPTLRLYGWREPTVSLGRNERWQRVVSPKRLRQKEIRLVRRPTGGRAVLHHREITYSVTGSPKKYTELGENLDDTLALISETLALGLKHLGAEVQVARRDHPLPRNEGVCFESTTRYELSAVGRKLVGSAQFRTPTAFLQHGSMPLYSTLQDLKQVGPEPTGGVDDRQAADAMVPWTNRSLDGAGRVLVEAFAHRFRSSVKHMSLAAIDTPEVRRLVVGRYALRSWTYRR